MSSGIKGVTSVYGGVLPSTNVENANQEVYLGTFASNPEVDFHTNMIQVFKLIGKSSLQHELSFFWKKQPLWFETILIKIIYMYADPTGDQACLWISQPVTLSIIKLDQNQCYISYTSGYQEF